MAAVSVARPRDTFGWLAAGWLALLACAAGPLAISRGAGSLSIALLVLLLGGAVWAGAYALGGLRVACGVALGAGILLNAARLPVAETVPHQGKTALYGANQSLVVDVQGQPGPAAPALRAMLGVISRSPTPPYLVAADVQGQSLRWRCPRTDGPRWLDLPLPGSMPLSGPIAVRLRVEGQPDRTGDYLEIYLRRAEDTPLVSLMDLATVPAGDLRCTAA